MWQSLLFAQLIKNKLSNRCGIPLFWVRFWGEQRVEHARRVQDTNAYFVPSHPINRSHGVMVSTLDFESSDPSSNFGETSLSQTFISFFCFCFCRCCLLLFFFFIVLSCFPFTAFHYPHVWLKILKKVINGRLDRETTGFILIGIFKRASSFRKETKIWTIPFLPPPCYKQVLEMKKKIRWLQKRGEEWRHYTMVAKFLGHRKMAEIMEW